MMLTTVLIFNVIIISVVIIGIYKYVKPQQKNNANLMNEDNGKKTDNKLLNPNEAIKKEIITLIKDLNNLGELSLIETAQKLDELSKLHDTDKLEKKLKDLRFKKYKLENKIRQDKKSQFRTNKQGDISKDQFISITLLSILSTVILFILTFYIAIEVEDYFIQTGAGPFDLEDTWWIWTIYLIVVFLIEKKLFSIRKRSKYFKSNVFRVLYYLSTFSTIAGSVVYFLTINVQLFSRVGRSTRDGFLLQAFFFCYILPVIFWVVYYAVIKNNDVYQSFLDKKKQKRSKESKVLKRDQAIKELKEAKELLDLGILSKEEYDELSKKLKPIILDN